jgi:hypothetical protein
MSVSVTCRACGARLKTPPGSTKTKARCPKCDARINLTSALSASAYLPTGAKPAKPARPEAPVEPPPEPEPLSPAPPPPVAEREEDPLPYANLNLAALPGPGRNGSAPAVEASGGLTPPGSPETTGSPEPLLSLDDSPPAPPAPEGPPPFRAPARVVADTADLFTGPCDAVFVAHGLFLESVPYRPFLYAPAGSPAFVTGRRSVVVSLADGRAVTVEFLGRDAGRVAEDAAAFLVGQRGVPDPREYRRSPPWLMLLALIFALGLAVGPVVMAQTTQLDLKTGLLVGAGFAAAGLLANAAVVLLARMPVYGKVAVMAGVGVVGTGVFLLAATAYLLGRRHEAAQAPPPEPPPAIPAPPPPPPPTPPPDPPRPYLPTPVDVAYRDGVYRFDEGPDDVTALALSADGTVLIAGYKNGSTRVWRLDQPTIDPFSIGPRADGAPTRIRFDGTGAVVYMTCGGGTVAALWNDPPQAPVKIPGEHLAAFPSPTGERFAAVRGNALVMRYVPTELVKKPPGKGPGFTVTAPRQEVQPIDVKAQLGSPGRLTFLAWHPTGQLLGGTPDGTVFTWGASGPGASLATRDHKGAVRAWAASPATWDFATGDDRGAVGLWENKAMKPRTFTAATGAITQLAFSPTGWRLAVAEPAAIRVWDFAANRATVRVSRVASQVAFGPHDDLLLLSDGKTVELWHLDELAKQP